MAVSLKTVDNNPEQPPYAEDTRVRGWRFELDHERINQSDTWALAPPEMRPWLLMLWHVAWQQVPAGSMSSDDDVIAAKIGMDRRQFAAHRDILLRGWTRYADGRLYHPVITEQVLKYQEHNRKERERVAAWRAKKAEEEKAKSNNRVTRNKDVSTDTGTGTGTGTGVKDLVVSDDTTCQNSTTKPPERVPYQQIVELWTSTLPELPRPVKLSDARKKQIRARWLDELPDIDAWRECFEYIRESKFLMGKVHGVNGRPPFRATLQWVTKLENLLKIYEGDYHRG